MMSSPKMGEEWVQRVSRSKKITYYFNTKTGVSQWEHPSMTPEKGKEMPDPPQPRDGENTSKASRNASQREATPGKASIQDCAQSSTPAAPKKCDQETKSTQEKPESLSEHVPEVPKKKKKKKKRKKSSSNSSYGDSPHVEQGSSFDKGEQSSTLNERCTRTTTTTSEIPRQKVACHNDIKADISLINDDKAKQNKEIGAADLPILDKEKHSSRPPAKRKKNISVEGTQRKETVSTVKDVDKPVIASMNKNANAKPNEELRVANLPRKVASSESVSEMEVDLILSTEGKVLVVVDTNVLIHSIAFLRTIKGKSIGGPGDVMLTIPWIVMQELDLLKGPNFMPSTPLSSSARKALNFLHQNRTDPNIKGQSYVHFLKTVKEKDVKGTSDDKILHYCLQCKKKYGRNLVVLLSNDKNLCVKASFSGIPSSGDTRFIEEIQKQVKSHGDLSFSSDDNDVFSSSEDQESSGRCSPEGALSCISPMEWLSPEPVTKLKTAGASTTKDLEILCKDVVKKNESHASAKEIQSKKSLAPSAGVQRDTIKSAVPPPASQSTAPQSTAPQSTAPQSNVQPKQASSSAQQTCEETKGSIQGDERKKENRKRPAPGVASKPSEDQKEQKLGPPLDSNLALKQLKRKYTGQLMGFLKLALVILLRHEMMEIYTDHWLDIVHKKPPWSLLDALHCIRKHYTAVFGFLLGKTNTQELDRLVSIVTFIGEDGYFTLKQLKSFCSASAAILTPLNESAKYKDITIKSKDDIERVHKQWMEETENGLQAKASKILPKIAIEPSKEIESVLETVQETESVQETEDMCISPPATISPNTHSHEAEDGAMVKNQEARREGDGMDHVTFSILSVFEAIYLVLKYHRDVIVWSFKHLASGCPIEGLPTKDESLNYLASALPLIEAIIHSLHRLMTSSLPAAHCAEVVERIHSYDEALKLDLSLGEFTHEMLQQFILTEDNRERLVVGSQQLSEVLQQLHECRVRLCQF